MKNFKAGDFGLCQNQHPFGVAYRKQQFENTLPSGPTYCPWCDWKRLRGALSERPDPWSDTAAWNALHETERLERALPV